MNIDSIDIEGGVLLFREPDRRRAFLFTLAACLLFALTVFLITNGLVIMLALLLPTGTLFIQGNRERKETALEYRTINFQMAQQHLRIFIDRAILHDGGYDDQCLICLQQDIRSAMLTMGNVFRLDVDAVQSFIMRGETILKHETHAPYTVTIAMTGESWHELKTFLNRHGIETQ